MPPWLKVVLGIVLFFIVLAIGGAFFAVNWVRINKTRLQQEATKVRDEGRSFGEGKEPVACMDEAIRRYKEKRGFAGQIRNQLFMEACLDASSFPATFCATVPQQTEFIDSSRWALNECQKRGMPNDQSCTTIVMSVVQRCDRQRSSH